MKPSVTRLDYCHYLVVSQSNYTLTYFADHCERFSHDAINRYLRGERIPPRLIWENVRGQAVTTAQGDIVFDNSIISFKPIRSNTGACSLCSIWAVR